MPFIAFLFWFQQTDKCKVISLRGDDIQQMDFSLHFILVKKDIIWHYLFVTGRPEMPTSLSKANVSEGDNDSGRALLQLSINKGGQEGMPDVWSVSSGRVSVVQAASVSVF